MAIRYVVKDEHTLGYINDVVPNTMGVLHGNPFNYGHNWKNGPVTIFGSSIRPAKLDDFEAYRCEPPKNLIFDADGCAMPLEL